MNIRLDELKDALMVSSDAYEVGTITDIRYNPFEWNVVGLKVRPAKKASSKLAAGFGKSLVLILPKEFILNDVMLLSQPMERLKDITVPDNSNISSVSSLINQKMVTRDNALIGSVANVMIDPKDWKVASVVIQLEKTAIEAMGMKKGLFSKIMAEIRTDAMRSAADMIHLDAQMGDVRENMTILE